MKRMVVFLAAMGISAAAFATEYVVYQSDVILGEQPVEGLAVTDPSEDSSLTQMEEQSYDRIAVVEEYILVPADTIVLVPLPDDEESDSHVPG